MTTRDKATGILTEAEIQVLIAVIELDEPKETPNNNFYQFYPASLEQAAMYFRKYREDWTEAYRTLAAREMIYMDGADAQLTQAGRAIAIQWRDERPPIWYWYKEFYADAPVSPAYRKFCETLYGRHLCQQGFSDMRQINTLVAAANLSPSHCVLDLGCGNGMLAEYLSDRTGASVHGIDYIPEAIQQAQERTVSKRHRLTFQLENMDSLNGKPQSFDTVVSMDSLYMPRDLNLTLLRIRDLMVSSGQLFVFHSHFSSAEVSSAEPIPFAEALSQAGFGFDVTDFSRDTYELMQRKRLLAEEMRERFAAEGRSYLYDHLYMESVDPLTPYNPNTVGHRRYLYHARK